MVFSPFLSFLDNSTHFIEGPRTIVTVDYIPNQVWEPCIVTVLYFNMKFHRYILNNYSIIFNIRRAKWTFVG